MRGEEGGREDADVDVDWVVRFVTRWVLGCFGGSEGGKV